MIVNRVSRGCKGACKVLTVKSTVGSWKELGGRLANWSVWV